ncbi:transposase [Bryobacter aggregatus]|uniref:transposase n=1 Tax=Bryobacter aggregatus TaxID=360054 RepID=UPI0009B5C361|nr:transposase [Bryobacter aggregatus]
MRGRGDLKDDQWEVVEPVLRPQRREDQRGSPWHDTRCVWNGVLWVLGSGVQWRELPERYPHPRPVTGVFNRGCEIGPTRRGKGTKIIAIAAGDSLPLAVAVDSASPAGCQLVEDVLAGSFLDEMPKRLIGDNAYDSDKLDEKLAEEYGIEMIAPNRRNRGKTQDGRPLRRYRAVIARIFSTRSRIARLI